jgi:isopenicillin-N epimerase
MSAYLAVTAALAFHQRLGGPALMARNAALAADGAALLARRLGTEIGNAVRGHNTPAAAMGLIRLPEAGNVTPEHAVVLRERLLDAATDAPVNVLDGIAWLRISAQAYNELEDFERLAEVISKALARPCA